MKCDKCGKEIKSGEKFFTVIGVNQCEECNNKSNGTVNLDFILSNMEKDHEK